ncbi:MAG: Lar family restriction alleviation protein [Oscillospiraceae bacterium]|nr:Lar family restriction alleviation protein [Oscillospiraceae bacterium]
MPKSLLKPCPFCGGDVTVDYNSYTKAFFVACDNGECELCVNTLPCKTAEQAIKTWNKRADN